MARETKKQQEERLRREMHDRWRDETLRRAIDQAALPALKCVEFAEQLVFSALRQGLPFPVDVDGEDHLRAARRHLKRILHDVEDRT